MYITQNGSSNATQYRCAIYAVLAYLKYFYDLGIKPLNTDPGTDNANFNLHCIAALKEYWTRRKGKKAKFPYAEGELNGLLNGQIETEAAVEIFTTLLIPFKYNITDAF